MYIVDPQGQHRNVDWFNHGKRGKADLCSGKEEKKRSERLDPTRKTLFYMQLTHSPHPTIILAHFLPLFQSTLLSPSQPLYDQIFSYAYVRTVITRLHLWAWNITCIRTNQSKLKRAQLTKHRCRHRESIIGKVSSHVACFVYTKWGCFQCSTDAPID